MKELKYDVVVIGTGPGGEGAAMQASKWGKSVAAVEMMPRIGGSCTHRGTIPSKALRFAIFQVTNAINSGVFHDLRLSSIVHFPDLLKSARSVIDKQVGMRLGFYDRNEVPIHRGHARFLDTQTIEVSNDEEGRVCLKADAFVIATGSRPFRPPEIDFSHPHVFDSDTILELKETPHSISIYGAGVIGCEYASMFR
ncbi:MAG: FAD-dependent oxidoreductase, partial [Planctomycetales bacterium]|nr:FAD-dependent oxidoreductase [Planctomycetales bacterium]